MRFASRPDETAQWPPSRWPPVTTIGIEVGDYEYQRQVANMGNIADVRVGMISLNLSFNRCKDSIMDANVRDQSKHLIGVLRHSMTSYCLAPRSLSKPYSARHAARHGIVCKVSSAFTASTAVDGCGMSEDAGMHNVMPVPSIAEWLDEISSLGSPEVPKVESMEPSQYQIKVENCTATKEYISPSPEAACRGENSTVEREAETQHLWPIDLSPVRTDPGGQPKYGFW
ncbi:uncharacterized protein CLUP02_18392 [Colletotrichum lupini]|uniref:Uncharacterized protein n=1 Tax=Colletotrichum lupini TaxID=145971 RepID=A0A9Q8SI25_9PEZI|nr:uncharacterized protein CLUP02_18392 [Colletotrichum lupini]UQC76877.1 hypothetical protein CLUP02_18392 [Colletotrichum lupini]